MMDDFDSGRDLLSGAPSAIIEDARRLDIGWFSQREWLDRPKNGILFWDGGMSIEVSTNHDLLTLRYAVKVKDRSFRKIQQVIYIERTACQFGGERKWFRCPHCGRRVASIFGAGELFLCRHCHRLRYNCQALGGVELLIYQQQKLAKRIFEDYRTNRIIKKKGMHQKTFERLLRKYLDLPSAANDAFSRRFNID